MASDVNADQIAYWNGRAGATWTEHHARTDAMLSPITPVLLGAAAPAPGERVLDVGCGCGETTKLVADAVGAAGAVVGVDVSESMLGVAKERAGAAAHVTLRLEDAATATFDAPFDLLISRFGVMFFQDPSAAFRNLWEALRPGGRLAFVCWQPMLANTWATLPMTAARPFLEAMPVSDPNAPGPFAFGDRRRVTEILAGAGFSSVALTPHAAPLPLGSDLDDAMGHMRRVGPLARAIAELPEATVDRVMNAAREAIAPIAGDGDVKLPGAYWLVTATKG